MRHLFFCCTRCPGFVPITELADLLSFAGVPPSRTAWLAADDQGEKSQGKGMQADGTNRATPRPSPVKKKNHMRLIAFDSVRIPNVNENPEFFHASIGDRCSGSLCRSGQARTFGEGGRLQLNGDQIIAGTGPDRAKGA